MTKLDRPRRGVLRLTLLLMVAFGLVMAGLVQGQRRALELQRASLQRMRESRNKLHYGLVQLALDGQGEDSVRRSLDTFRSSCATYGLNSAALETRVLTILARPRPEFHQLLETAQQVDSEAEKFFERSRVLFVARQSELASLMHGAIFLESVLGCLAGLLLLPQMQRSRKLTATLIEKEAQLKAVVDNLPESYLYQYEHQPGQPPRFHYASSGIERVHGLSVADVLRDAPGLLSQLTPEHAALLAQQEKESARNLSDFDMEMEFRKPGGLLRLLRVRSRPRRLSDGRILWDGFASDVTERRRAETRFQALFENAYEGIYQSTPDGRLLDVNPSMARTFGFSSREEMLAEWPEAHRLYARPDERRELVKLLAAHGLVKNFEFQGRRQDGSSIWISTNVHAVRNASGVVEYYEGIGLDISERKESLDRIRHLNRVHALRTEINHTILRGATTQATLEAACRLSAEQGQFACAAICVLGSRPEVRSHAGGPLPAELFKLPAECPWLGEAGLGRSGVCNKLSAVQPECAWREQALHLGYRSMAALPLWQGEEVTKLFVLFSSQDDFFNADEIQLLEGLAADISFALAMHAREQQNLKTEEELRLSQEHIRQAQKLEGIGQLAGGVAHDFNNILAVILMQVEILLCQPELSQELTEGLGEIHSSAERAANLTRQLLLFSRRQIMVSSDLDLNELVTQLVRMLRRIIGEDIALELKLCPRPVYVRADPGMIDQVLLNLAVNARDAMPRGGTLTIGLAEEYLSTERLSRDSDVSEGNYCVLTVSDTGCGMPPEVIDHIFEPFFTTKELGKGTGLGLATTFGIIRQHRGLIEVDSRPEEGATFHLYLPTCARPDLSQPKVPEAAGTPPQGSEVILLVEDDAVVRNLTARVLRSSGYTVLEASHGREAMALWNQQGPTIDLLLSDMVMPEQMSGPELARRCRQDAPELPVLFMSGYSEDVAGRELALEPGQAFLQKPFTPTQILQILRDILDREGAARPRAPSDQDLKAARASSTC